jgi:hypothetical protein
MIQFNMFQDYLFTVLNFDIVPAQPALIVVLVVLRGFVITKRILVNVPRHDVGDVVAHS